MTAETADCAAVVAGVQVFIDVPAESAGNVRTFWSDVTGWPTAWPWENHHELATFLPPAGTPGVSVQEADVTPRVHLDVYPTDNPNDLVARFVDLGARVERRHEWWTVLESPGGLPVCIIDEPAGEPPPATAWPDGHRSRVLQVCIDIPDDHWRTEAAFWQSALGWPQMANSRAEYRDLEAPPTSPLRVLLQRLGTADTSATVRAHLDLGTDDLDAEVQRLVRAGATRPEQPADADGLVMLIDPADLPFCVTTRRP